MYQILALISSAIIGIATEIEAMTVEASAVIEIATEIEATTVIAAVAITSETIAEITIEATTEVTITIATKKIHHLLIMKWLMKLYLNMCFLILDKKMFLKNKYHFAFNLFKISRYHLKF